MKKIGGVTYHSNTPLPGEADNFLFVDIDQDVCIGCKNCTHVCPTGAILSTDPRKRWAPVHLPEPELCIYCGQCLINCPVHAIYEGSCFIDKVKSAIAEPGKLTVAMVAPSIRYTIGEEFGLPHGDYEGEKMFEALRLLGFDYVWDIEFGADVTIMEEGYEFLARASGKSNKPLPQFTSCCPGWMKYVETFFPKLIPNLSTTKTPAQILGVLAKTYGAETVGADPANMYTVAIMPCISKKFEGLRAEYQDSGYRDVDATIDTRELASMIKDAGIDFANLKPSSDRGKADDLLGLSTGAGTIFGVTGGVMEAVLRLLAEKLDGRELEHVEFTEVRGEKGVREATLTAGGQSVKVAVVNGLNHARRICEEVEAGNSPYAAIEVMACPGGCVNGGGQPYPDWNKRCLSSMAWLRDVLKKLENRYDQTMKG